MTARETIDRERAHQSFENYSEAKFAKLVRRFIRLVYQTCLRELNDRELAEDATQAVFLILARKQGIWPNDSVLIGWLFRTSRLVARDFRKAERRRLRRERIATEAASVVSEEDHAERLASSSALNEALGALRETEREAVLLRFYDQMSYQEVGSALGMSDDTAQKCVSRALEKMRRHLLGSGIVLSIAPLAALIAKDAAAPPPPAVFGKALLASSSLPGGTVSSALVGTKAYHVSQGVLHAMRIKWIAALSTVSVFVVCGILLASQIHSGPRLLMEKARSHYAGARAFSMIIYNHDSSGLFPGDYTQRLDWQSDGKFTLKVTSPGNKTVPDFVSDGSQVMAIYPDGHREVMPPPDSNNSPGWEVSAGFILGWLENTPLSNDVIGGIPGAVMTRWSYGPRTQWHGRHVKELILRLTFGPQAGGRSGAASFFVDPATKEYVGEESQYVGQGSSEMGYALYENQKITR